jgi:hypothetical protein
MDSNVFPFGKGCPRKPRPFVETTPRIAAPPHRGVAREEVRVVVDGVLQTLEIVRQPRIHGQEGFWRCPTCGTLRWHLYLHNGEVGCRVCLGLSYSSDHTRNTAALRARKLRRKLGDAPSLLSPLPPRPRYWRRDYYVRTLAKLVAAESVLAARLRAMVGRRRKRAWPAQRSKNVTRRSPRR